MELEPIRSQKEADDVMEYITTETMRINNISRDQAQKRIKALFRSDILRQGHHDSKFTQNLIDEFLSKPQP